jgi:hypothetical protein
MPILKATQSVDAVAVKLLRGAKTDEERTVTTTVTLQVFP